MSESVLAPAEPRPAPPPGRLRRWLVTAAVWAAVAGAAAAGYVTRDRWLPVVLPTAPPESAHPETPPANVAAGDRVVLSEQAQKNLRLTSRALKAETFWKTVSIPGMVIDRPGFSDRGVVAPATGVVTRIHRLAGDTVRPGEVLFTLKLLSESLHQAQADLYKAAQDIGLAKAQLKLLAASESVPAGRITEVENQLARLEAAARAYRHALLTRGLTPAQVDAAAGGMFLTELTVPVPTRLFVPAEGTPGPGVEVQELRVELGQQVDAGQTLCLLADHRRLAVEGRAFADEAPLLERAVREGWPVAVDFGEADTPDWPPTPREFPVSYLANTFDPESRTFRFLLPLDNPSKTVERDGTVRVLWRFRPGQRVRVLVRAEKLDGVFVLPAAAVVREGADAFVFRRTGDAFDRKPVHLLHLDRESAVVANDGSVPAGVHVALAGAAQLNRMLKAGSGAVPPGFHIHADGSVHMGAH